MEEFSAHLETVLASQTFASSPRRGRLLRYLVERTLAGQGEATNEYAIGVDVFDKPASFDPRIESIVRTEMGRLRQKLKDYYSSEGRDATLAIDIPLRTYIAVCSFRHPEPASAPAPIEKTPPPKAIPWHRIAVAVIILLSLTAGVYAVFRSHKAAANSIGSLAVLPFLSLSADRHDDYLADGVTEELTNDLAQWKGVRIVARTSASQFKSKGADIRDIGRKLNVDTILEGSVAKQGDRIRIVAQLIRTSDGYHLWSKAFDARSADMMKVQQEIAHSIAGTVRNAGNATLQIAPPTATANPEALDLYLRGSYQHSRLTADSLKESVSLFQSAIQKDPKYVRAYLGLAYAQYALVTLTADAPLEGVERVRASLRKVLELDPGSTEAHVIQAEIAYQFDWNWPEAQRQYNFAFENGPRSSTRASYGAALATRGNFAVAQTQCQAAESSDPLGLAPRSCQFWNYYLQHRYFDARATLKGMLDLTPDSLYAHALSGLVAALEHNCAESHAQFNWVAAKYPLPVGKIGLAYASACSGDGQSARVFLKQAEAMGRGYTSPYQLALGYAFLHDKETAIKYLGKSAAEREGQIHYLKYDPVFAEIRSDPRYAALEKLVGSL